jgi:hypothetical protein
MTWPGRLERRWPAGICQRRAYERPFSAWSAEEAKVRFVAADMPDANGGPHGGDRPG